MLLIFIGPPGAGKGTQSLRLCQRFSIPHLSTGDILRKAKSDGTELGKIVGPIMDSGGLVSDELMVEVVRERTTQTDCAEGYMLDGFPRSIPQASEFDKLLERRQQKLNAVIELHVPYDELRRRLIGRFHQLKDPRPEDQPEAIEKRLKLFEAITQPLRKYYTERNLLLTVDGIGTPDEVFERILQGLYRDT